MLEAILGDGRMAIACDDYVLTRAYNGQDSISFSLSRRDPAVKELKERTRVYETSTGQTFLVSGIDAGQDRVDYALKKDLGDWERTVYPSYTNGSASATAAATIQGVLPQGWTLRQVETDTLSAYLSLEGPTALEVVEQCMEAYDCAPVFDNASKLVSLHFPKKKTLGTAFFVETANLREAPEYKSKAGSLVTRLYARGAEGLSFASINGGKDYVECYDYTDEVVAGFWRDDRYTVAAHLLAAARERVRELSQPERSWTLSVCDLGRIDPAAWPGLELELHSVVRLIDRSLGQVMDARVTELRCCPHRPERNEVSITNVAGTLRAAGQGLMAVGTRYQRLLADVDQLQRQVKALETSG